MPKADLGDNPIRMYHVICDVFVTLRVNGWRPGTHHLARVGYRAQACGPQGDYSHLNLCYDFPCKKCITQDKKQIIEWIRIAN